MAYPHRCNKRACQARRSLKRKAADYVRAPRCHIPGCSGMMYFDAHRFKNGVSDRGEVCGSDCLPYRHMISNRKCRKNAEYVAKRYDAPRSKHSPIPATQWAPF